MEIVRGIMEKGYRENEAFDPRRIFTEGTFTPLDGTGG